MNKKTICLVAVGAVLLISFASFSTIAGQSDEGGIGANQDEGGYDISGGLQINSYCKDGDHYLWVQYKGLFKTYPEEGHYQIGTRGNYKRLGIFYAQITVKIKVGGHVKHTETGIQIGPFVLI
jgi:hypothetical protein